MTLSLIAAALAGYLFGSIPFGLVLTRLAGLGDIRAIGSGNIGATNVLRTGRKGLAAATLVLDSLKGTAAVLLAPSVAIATATLTGGEAALVDGGYSAFSARVQTAQLAGGFGAFVGHLYPAWLGFRGGKGVATYIGVLLGLFWPAAAAFCGVWLALALTLRYSSLAALIASLAPPIATVLLGRPDLAIPLVPLTLLLVYKHHANIRRLLAGQEPKIGAKA